VPFDGRMLSWSAGPRDSDGVWAPHWYGSVHSSTGFAAYHPPAEPLPARLEPLADQCLPYFERLHRHRLAPGAPASQRPPQKAAGGERENRACDERRGKTGP
jgi:hypothetical protein